MSHAVERADAVVVLMSSRSAMTDVELAFAYRHNRPVVGLRLRDQEPNSEIQAMLQRYGRARVVDCADIEDCVAALRSALSDAQFGATIREAAGEIGHA
jgi:nucleoside 2-deoxyribosyltransferase